jgi:hypothetical protein
MFGKLFKRKPKEKESSKGEFTFIWYKKMRVGNTTHYTKPFRTKIIANSRAEAVSRLQDFIANKMTAVIINADEFNDHEISKLTNLTDQMNKLDKQMGDLFKGF